MECGVYGVLAAALAVEEIKPELEEEFADYQMKRRLRF